MKTDYKSFEEEVEKRGIEYLVHFTPTINLLSIFEHGKLLSRFSLEKVGIEQTDILDFIEFTDQVRFDDKNFINLSVQHPNSFLFKKFQQKTIDLPHITWCVLLIDKRHIYEAETLFSITNAANSHNKNHIGVTGDLAKFRMLFAETVQVVTSYGARNIYRGDLKPKYPTDEQAEVLVKDWIPVSDILKVCFKDEHDLARTRAALQGFKTDKFIVQPDLFNSQRI